jgi:nucleotide-binding universal stress UspA family protein
VSGEVLVATDGSPAAAVAVRYALEQAQRRGCAVRIVHALPSQVPVPAGLEDAVRHAGADLLLDTTMRAQAAAPSVRIRSSLLPGPRGTALATAALDADLVVLGRSSTVSRTATGSTVAALVAHTDLPVRVVPPDWSRSSGRAEVVVGVKDVRTCHDLVERGFEIAEELGETLVLLHAWGLPSGYEEVMALADTDAWNAHLADLVERAVAPVRERHPGVTYEVRVVHERPVRALEVASRRACLLLLGRPEARHAGSRREAARVLANAAGCPIEIGPAARAVAPELDLALESEGRLLR